MSLKPAAQTVPAPTPEPSATAAPASAQTPEQDTRVATPPVPARDRVTSIPVLMYHEIGDVENNNYVRASEFEAQVRWLAENGYHTVSLAEAYRHFNDFKPIAQKPVVLTFDDGYATFHDIVVPTLQKYGFRATAFIVTGLLGRPGHMTWEQVIDSANQGTEIGAHSISHPDLRKISGERLMREITEPKRLLEERTRLSVQFFCYPSGKYSAEALEVIKNAGYLGGVTTEYGPIAPEQSPLIWPRIRILRGETSASFATKIRRASGE